MCVAPDGERAGLSPNKLKDLTFWLNLVQYEAVLSVSLREITFTRTILTMTPITIRSKIGLMFHLACYVLHLQGVFLYFLIECLSLHSL
mgnify:CR=1 FL=1